MKNLQKGYIIIYLLILIVLLVAGGFYWYLKDKQNTQMKNITQDQVSAPTASSTPESAFRQFRARFDVAKDLKDVANSQIEFGSKEIVVQAKAGLTQIDSMDKGFQERFLSSIKTIPTLAQIISISTVISGAKATLSVKSNSTSTPDGTVTMVNEGGTWKMVDEKWLLPFEN